MSLSIGHNPALKEFVGNQTTEFIGSITSFVSFPCDRVRTVKDLRNDIERLPESHRIKNNTISPIFRPPRTHNLDDQTLRFFITTQAIKILDKAFENPKGPFTTEPKKFTYLHIYVQAALSVEEYLFYYEDPYFIGMWECAQIAGVINYINLFEYNDFFISKFQLHSHYSVADLSGCVLSIFSSNTLNCSEPTLKLYVFALLNCLQSNYKECTGRQRNALKQMCVLYIHGLISKRK